MAGIGPSGDLGYMNGVTESLAVGGRFEMDGKLEWSSFSGVGGEVEKKSLLTVPIERNNKLPGQPGF